LLTSANPATASFNAVSKAVLLSSTSYRAAALSSFFFATSAFKSVSNYVSYPSTLIDAT